MNPTELIDKAAAAQGLSQARLAKRVNVTPASLSNLRTGKGELSDDTYVKLAELAGIDPALVIIEKHERKAGTESRKVWEKLRRAIGASGTTLAVCMLPMHNLQNINEVAAHHYTKVDPINHHYATL
ncbi:MAG: helix-turn-helix transcriptional regulator [Acidithiobacillus sp.]|nr:helix-turn-helix transcriptional regulator [Acidithiobacillus sp.]